MADKKLFTPLSGTQRIFEAVLIAITLMAAYLLLALLTYHPADPGWSQTSWQGEVKNLAGSAGAWLPSWALTEGWHAARHGMAWRRDLCSQLPGTGIHTA